MKKLDVKVEIKINAAGCLLAVAAILKILPR